MKKREMYLLKGNNSGNRPSIPFEEEFFDRYCHREANSPTPKLIDKKPLITIQEIHEIVFRFYRLSCENNRARKRELVRARKIVMALSRKYTKQTWERIGKFYGKSHATALYAFETIKNEIDIYLEIRSDVTILEDHIKLNYEINPL